jgi:hypothetical protein
MSPQVLRVLIGRVPELLQPALLSNYRRHPVRGEVFPGLIPSSSLDDETQGILLQGLSETELTVLDWFEGHEYVRRDVKVQVPAAVGRGSSALMDTQCYEWSNPLSELDLTQNWDFENFQKTRLEWYLTNTVKPCRVELNNKGIGVLDT